MSAGVMQNWTLKLFSLLVGLGLYTLVNVQITTPIDVEFRLQYRLADGIMMVGEPLETVGVTMQGPWSNFRHFETDDLEPIVIDLSTAGPGKTIHQIDLKHVDAPGGMSVLSLRESELVLDLDRKISKQVAVQVDPVGRPAFGYEIVEIRVDPPRVRVEGPLSIMKTLDFVYTRDVDVAEREDDLSTEVELRVPQVPLRLLTKSVKVLVDIGEEIIERTFRNVPVAMENAPKRSRLVPGQVIVTLKGPRRIVDKMNREEVLAYVDALPEADDPEIRTVEKTIQIRSELPERVQVVGTLARVELQLPKKRKRRR